MTDYLTSVELVDLHTSLGKRFGGKAGVRDAGAVDMAALRPQNEHYPDLVAKTAALMESIAIGRPFYENNLRTAVAAADIFLRINHQPLKIPSEDLYQEVTRLYDDGMWELKHLDTFLLGAMGK